MVVCICANVNEKAIIQQTKDGKSLEQIQKDLDVCNNCCCCEKAFRDLHNEHKTRDT